jgi:hypothetical protein
MALVTTLFPFASVEALTASSLDELSPLAALAPRFARLLVDLHLLLHALLLEGVALPLEVKGGGGGMMAGAGRTG